MCSWSLLYTLTSTHQQSLVDVCGGMCVFIQMFPSSFYLYFLLPKTGAQFFFWTCSFDSTGRAYEITTKHQHKTLNELKQAPKLCIAQTRVGPFYSHRLTPSPNRQIFIVTYFHITPQTSQLSWHLRHWQCILYRLKQATYSLLIKGPDLRQRLTGTRGVSSALTSGPFRLETSKAAYSSTSTHVC